MATEREISRVRHDPAQWRGITRHLIDYAEKHDLEERHLKLLATLQTSAASDEISYRQAEWLLDIRDDVDYVSEYRNVSVKFLIRAVYENQYGVDDDDDASWIKEIWRQSPARLRKRDARRLYTIAKLIGLLED